MSLNREPSVILDEVGKEDFDQAEFVKQHDKMLKNIIIKVKNNEKLTKSENIFLSSHKLPDSLLKMFLAQRNAHSKAK